MTVEEFIDTNNHSLKKELIELRKLIKTADPKLTEQIKWNAPSFCHKGEDRITFNLSKKDVLLIIFHRGAKAKAAKLTKPILADDSGLLEWPAFDRAVMRVRNIEEVKANKEVIKTLVKDWINVTSHDLA